MAALATLLARDQGEKLWTKEDSPVDESNLLAPMFVTQPHDLQIYEGQSAHFDCRVEPTGTDIINITTPNIASYSGHKPANLTPV